MYLTVKQQVKHLSKEDYRSIKELCHIAKNLTNQAIYNIRQHYFAEGKYLNYGKNYALLKSSDNYRTLNSNMAQQILKEEDVHLNHSLVFLKRQSRESMHLRTADFHAIFLVMDILRSSLDL